MTKPTLDRSPFTLHQIQLICATPKDVLELALPEAFGVKSGSEDWYGSLRIISKGATICEVSYNFPSEEWGYAHGLSLYANPKLEAAAKGLITRALVAAQDHALRTSNDESPEAVAARALAEFVADPDAVPEDDLSPA
jgi:hypothetical protein